MFAYCKSKLGNVIVYVCSRDAHVTRCQRDFEEILAGTRGPCSGPYQLTGRAIGVPVGIRRTRPARKEVLWPGRHVFVDYQKKMKWLVKWSVL